MSDLACNHCPMIDLLDRKWVRKILRALMLEETLRFSELEKRLTGISPKTLTERLRDLEKTEIIERIVCAEVPIRVEYRLTERGVELARLVVATCEWVQRWYSPK